MKSKKFGWNLCLDCNYKCSYCGVWKESGKWVLDLDLQKWFESWDRVYSLYGSCTIYISGGEPSVHPGFYELISRLSQKHSLDLCTNLSWDVSKIFNITNSRNIKISPTFHASNADSVEFVSKLAAIKKYLNRINYVVYPGTLEKYLKMSEQLMRYKISIYPLPLRGIEGEVLNDAVELKKIMDLVMKLDGTAEHLKYLSLTKSPKGKLCNTGKDFAMIYPDGRVYRCPCVKEAEIGVFFDPKFKLKEKSEYCGNNYCCTPYYFDN